MAGYMYRIIRQGKTQVGWTPLTTGLATEDPDEIELVRSILAATNPTVKYKIEKAPVPVWEPA